MQLFKSRKKNVCSQIWQQMTASDSNCLHAWVRKLPAQESLRTVVTPGREVSFALPRVLAVCLFVCLTTWGQSCASLHHRLEYETCLFVSLSLPLSLAGSPLSLAL